VKGQDIVEGVDRQVVHGHVIDRRDLAEALVRPLDRHATVRTRFMNTVLLFG
jgi:hypothetical protein